MKQVWGKIIVFLMGLVRNRRIAKPKGGAQKLLVEAYMGWWGLCGLTVEFPMNCCSATGQWSQNWELDFERGSGSRSNWGAWTWSWRERETGLGCHRGGPANGIQCWLQPELHLDLEVKEHVWTQFTVVWGWIVREFERAWSLSGIERGIYPLACACQWQ